MGKSTVTILVCSVVCGVFCTSGLAEPVSITYQGRLQDACEPAEGAYDFEFSLYSATVGPSQIAGPITKDDEPVADGYFTVKLDLDSTVFAGLTAWLEIAVRRGVETGAYTTLSPRQEVTPTPFALYALESGSGAADSDWAVDGNNMYSTVSGNVGIGTTSPEEVLEVDGVISAFRSGMSGVLQINDKRPTGGKWNLYSNEGNFSINESAATNQARLHISAGGNVGIGTSAPESKLSVGGNGQPDTAVYGQAAMTGVGTGVYGKSDIGVQGEGGDLGVVGSGSVTGGQFVASGNEGTGVWGLAHSTGGIGVQGTGAEKGVYGESTSGTGMEGRNNTTNNHGFLGGSWYGAYGKHETSGDYGVLGGDTYGVKSEGDLVVENGTFRGNITSTSGSDGAPFPKPAYNSGWVSIAQAETKVLTHNIGGNVDNYVVDVTMKHSTDGIQNYGAGMDVYGDISPQVEGFAWSNLTSSQISVRRGDDESAASIRVRIWVY